jgi:hypothetical protein
MLIVHFTETLPCLSFLYRHHTTPAEKREPDPAFSANKRFRTGERRESPRKLVGNVQGKVLKKFLAFVIMITIRARGRHPVFHEDAARRGPRRPLPRILEKEENPNA